jgi:predicted XRE-type DNA-binding protein
LFDQQRFLEIKKMSVLVKDFLTFHIENCGRTNAEIAELVGFPRANVISMLKSGATRLPINRITLMAKAIDVEPAVLFRTVMEEYMPGFLIVTDEVYQAEVLTPEEREIVQRVRLVARGRKPTLSPANTSLLDEWVEESCH